MIVYDCEIIRGICRKGEKPVLGVEYCGGWRDFQNMGISVICAYDLDQGLPRAFFKDNFHRFQRLVDTTDLVVGFNSLGFDNQLCAANGIDIPLEKSYDLLREIWHAAGLGPEFTYPSHAGYGLDAMAKANFGESKSGHGARAPLDWQQGRIGAVVDYCLRDVWLTTRLLKRVLSGKPVVDPKTPEDLELRHPEPNLYTEAPAGLEVPPLASNPQLVGASSFHEAETSERGSGFIYNESEGRWVQPSAHTYPLKGPRESA